jgi:hypothetical protein
MDAGSGATFTWKVPQLVSAAHCVAAADAAGCPGPLDWQAASTQSNNAQDTGMRGDRGLDTIDR